jgi:mono/diheme cytochrome c family protein
MKNNVWCILCAGVLAFFTIVLAETQISAASDSGKKLFDDKCALCHGRNGKGDGPAAAALSPKPVDFKSSKFWQSTSDKKIADTIRNGHGVMPAFDLSDDQIQAVIDYLKQSFKK